MYARTRSIPLPFDHLHTHIIKSPKSREIEARKACPILDHLSVVFVLQPSNLHRPLPLSLSHRATN